MPKQYWVVRKHDMAERIRLPKERYVGFHGRRRANLAYYIFFLKKIKKTSSIE